MCQVGARQFTVRASLWDVFWSNNGQAIREDGLARLSPAHDAVWARQLVADLKRRGYPVVRLLAQVGMNERSLNADDARIPIAKHAALLEMAAAMTGDGCLGLHFAQTRDVRDAGLLGYVVRSSPTLMDALKSLSRYRHVFSDAVEIQTHALAERGQLRWWFHGLDAQRSRQCFEFAATNVLRGMREISGCRLVPEYITFAHSRRQDIDQFERYFGCPVSFGCPENIIAMKLSDLHVPLLNSDDRLLGLLKRYGEDVLARHPDARPPLIERVEHLVADRLAEGEATLELTAAELGMSARTLSRKLAGLGTSFTGIIENVRKELVLRLLRDSNISVTEITFLVGYSEVSTLNHAFKRWTGKTPKAFRSEMSG